jgi:glc operon protein GlcG
MRTIARTLVFALVLSGAAPAAPHADALRAQSATVQVPTLSFEGARRIAAAAAEEAMKNNWSVSIAVVDDHGELLFFARMDGAHQQSVDISQAKARTAARWRRETKALQDAVEGGRSVLMAVEGMLPLEGGVPIILDGRVIGAVGVSGVTSAQDAQIAKAGIREVFPQ